MACRKPPHPEQAASGSAPKDAMPSSPYERRRGHPRPRRPVPVPPDQASSQASKRSIACALFLPHHSVLDCISSLKLSGAVGRNFARSFGM